jgi:hypothetical protein
MLEMDDRGCVDGDTKKTTLQKGLGTDADTQAARLWRWLLSPAWWTDVSNPSALYAAPNALSFTTI